VQHSTLESGACGLRIPWADFSGGRRRSHVFSV
jgi:hypothetical protein